MSTIIKPYDIGLIFKGDLALANLNGDKTQSRRPKNNILDKAYKLYKQGVPIRIWQRETFYCDHWQYPEVNFSDMADGMMAYRAGFDASDWEAGSPDCDENGRSCWKPAIHMPRWFSRFTGLEVEIVEEHLHAARLEDLAKEGTPQENGVREGFAEVWEAAYGTDPNYNYLANPLIYALKYKGMNENIDRMETEVEEMCGNCVNWQCKTRDQWGALGFCESKEETRYFDYNDCQSFTPQPHAVDRIS